MKIAVRRRLAAGVLATSSALVAGVLIAPASTAAANGLSISPNTVVNTQTVELTFRGTDADFTFGGSATFTRIGTSASFDVTIDDASGDPLRGSNEGTATVNFSDRGNGLGVDGPLDAGTYSVSADGEDGVVAGGGNDTCVSCFTILSPGSVAVGSVAPNSLRPGTAGNISILGNNFERLSRVDVLFPGSDNVDSAINANQAPLNSDGTAQTSGITTRTELKRRATVAPGAQAGTRDVRVTNLDGTSARCLDCFFVAGASLTSVNPTGDFNDPTQALTTLTFQGTAVAADGQPRLVFVGDPGSASRDQLAIEGQNVRNRMATSVTADYDLRNAAPNPTSDDRAGGSAYQPFVRGNNGVVNACDNCRFRVIQRDARTPTLTSLDRSSDAGVQKNLRQGESATFTATGTNFSKGATVVLPAGLTVTGVEFVNPEQFLVTIAAAADAAPGDKSVTARLTDGKTSPACNACLTVTPGTGASPGPSSSASPARAARPARARPAPPPRARPARPARRRRPPPARVPMRATSGSPARSACSTPAQPRCRAHAARSSSTCPSASRTQRHGGRAQRDGHQPDAGAASSSPTPTAAPSRAPRNVNFERQPDPGQRGHRRPAGSGGCRCSSTRPRPT